MKTKIRPIMVETTEASQLYTIKGILLFEEYPTKSVNVGNKQLILISIDPDDKIEVGDKFYNQDLQLIGELIVTNTYKNIFKVIATQSQLSLEYISKFIVEYNNGCVQDMDMEGLSEALKK